MLPLNYEAFNGLDGLPLVLIHPLGSNLRFWDPLVAKLGDQPAIALDWRGSGRSPALSEAWSIGDHADDVENLLASLEVSDAVLVGVAVGAMIAIAHATRHSGRVRGLVLANPSVSVTRARILERIAIVREKGLEALLPGAVDAAFNEMPKDDAYRRYFDIFRANDPENFVKILEGTLTADLTDALGRIVCPTLVVSGAKDKLFPPQVVQKVADLIPGSSLQLIEEAAHFPPYQTPEQFARLVLAFVRGLDSSESGRSLAS